MTDNYKELPDVVKVAPLETTIADTDIVSVSVKPAAEQEFTAKPLEFSVLKGLIGGGAVKTKTVKLTSADLLAGNAVDFGVAVPGKIIVPLYAVFSYEPGTIPYDVATAVKIRPSLG